MVSLCTRVCKHHAFADRPPLLEPYSVLQSFSAACGLTGLSLAYVSPNFQTQKRLLCASKSRHKKNQKACRHLLYGERSKGSLHRGFRRVRNHAPNNYFNKTTAFRYLICHQSRNIYYEPTALLLKSVLFSQCDSHCQPDFKRNSRFLRLKFLSTLNLGFD